MNEVNLIQAWQQSYNRIIFAQLAPTGLLITTVALLQFGLGQASIAVRIAALLILLASGILGALAEFAAADEAIGIAKELQSANGSSNLAKKVSFQARLLPIVKFVTPAIFVLIFIALALELLAA